MATKPDGLEKLARSTKKQAAARAKDRLAAFAAAGPEAEAEWSTCDPKWVLEVIQKITELGGGVIFGMTRDGGACSLTLMLDKSRQTLWFNGKVDLSEEMEGVCAILDTLD